MSPDEKKAKEFLQQYKLSVEKVERRTTKTPDFKALRENKLKFYCEIKTIEKDLWLDEKIQKATLGGGGRKDPIFNRLTDDIYKAGKQFRAVNPLRVYPNVLIMINHDKNCGFNDFLAVFTGDFYAQNGGRYPIYKNFSDGRIVNSKREIDLFIWLDDYKPLRFFFSRINNEYFQSLCEVFNMDPNKIREI